MRYFLFAGEIASAYEADGTEKSIGSAEFSGNGLSVSIKPYSIKTFKVRLKSSGEDAYQLQYASLPLSYNCKCSSFNEFRGEADFESGYSFAAELLPESLTVNGIPFQLGEKDAANGMTCNGDTIVLPEGKSIINCIFWLPLRTGTMPPLSGAEGTRVRSLYLPIPDLSDSGDIRDIPKVI